MGEPRRLWIPGPAGRLEAVLRIALPCQGAALLAHPHPEHGGTLHNPVVFHSGRELHRAGFTTLRFNFRGVGSSEGIHDNGIGEVQDLAAAASWLRGVSLDTPLLLVGYSFGSVCSIRHAADTGVGAGVVAIGLPVRRYRFEELTRLNAPLAVVQGGEDEFGTPDEVRRQLDLLQLQSRLFVVDGASHLFPGQAREVGRQVVAAAQSILERGQV